MNLPLIARFKSSGSPQTGLSPTVSIYRIDQNSGNSSTIESSQAMTELSDGLYKYTFSDFNPLYNYVFTFDAGAASDARYIEEAWNGLNSFVDIMPRGGGGSSVVSLTQKELSTITKSLKDALESFFKALELQIDVPEASTKEIEKLIKEFQKESGKEKKELLSLIDKASKKVEEVKTPKVEVRTEKVDTQEMSKNLATEFLKNAKIQKEDIDELFGEFAEWLMKENKQQAERIREQIRDEEREKLVLEFKSMIQ